MAAVFVIERTYMLICYLSQWAKVRHEYFELSDRINWGPANARLSQTRIIETSASTIASLAVFFFFSSPIWSQQNFPRDPGRWLFVRQRVALYCEGCRIYTRNPRIGRGPRGASVTALFRISELVTIVIARIIAEKLHAFLCRIVSLYPDRHGIESNREEGGF